MSESQAEQLDESKLGESVGDEGHPADDQPNDTALGVDDESIVRGGVIARDDVSTREGRHVDDTDDTGAGGDSAPGLVDTNDQSLTDPTRVDDERQLIADQVDDEVSPEADAVHITDD